jgi:hypothetical protein
MLVMFAHLAMKKCQIASDFFSKRELKVTTVMLALQKKNISFKIKFLHSRYGT